LYSKIKLKAIQKRFRRFTWCKFWPLIWIFAFKYILTTFWYHLIHSINVQSPNYYFLSVHVRKLCSG
jgi:hypothetical protein